jgi:hypothetical protein
MKTKKPLLGDYSKEPEFQNSENAGHQLLREPKFQLSGSYGLGCRVVDVAHILRSTATAPARDGRNVKIKMAAKDSFSSAQALFSQNC